MAFIFCFLNQFFFRGRGKGGERKLQQRSVLLSTTHCTSHVCYISLHIRESRTVGFWIPRYGFRTPGTGFQYLLVELGFWIPIVRGIPNSLSCIPGFHLSPGLRITDSTSKNLSDSPTWGDICITLP